MDSNRNQRKRGGRIAKNSNSTEKLPPQNIDHNDVIEVSAVAISPTLEETETNAPAAECRRSSRKKIIKFDVRDLLNKNRKTHKIQIEARIDSNAPTTSKNDSTCGIETSNFKTSSTREDLLSKQKTFLEKSAIFRRYSISQEHKPHPPPLPLPPLLGKANDSKDVGLSSSSSSRRLSRTQEFFSNVMIKPKQTTSLIVAQFESNTPCSVAAVKRKTLSKSIETKVVTRPETEYSSVVQQKKRGRPAKIKLHTSAENSVQEELAKKKMTPEKAKNWKEYKACLAQQSSSSKEGKVSFKIKEKAKLSALDQASTLLQKPNKVQYFDDALQSDLSRSDDDGNFSGFQSSKDDISCDSPALADIFLDKEIIKYPTSSKIGNNECKFGDEKKTSDGETRKLTEMVPNIKTKLIKIEENRNTPQEVDSKQKHFLTNANKIASGETSELTLESLETAKTETKDLPKVVSEVTKEINKTQVEIQNITPDIGQLVVSNSDTDNNNKTIISSDFSEIQEIESDINTKRSQLNIEEGSVQYKSNAEINESQEAQEACSMEIIDNTASKSLAKNTRIPDGSGDIGITKTQIASSLLRKDIQETIVEFEKQCEKCNHEKENISVTSSEPSLSSHIIQTVSDIRDELTTIDNSPKTVQIVEDNTPHTNITNSVALLSEDQMLQIAQPSTPSNERKSVSRTSSSSESENVSEHSSYSSEPFSTSSSSSPRSYKSADKLRVSIKHISLPKSPSTSSQTSTSEELNNCKLQKRKPPTTKRSKRLQKKCIEPLQNEDISEKIADCFQTNPSDIINVEHTFGDQISTENIVFYGGENETEICRNDESKVNRKEDESTHLVKTVITEPIMQETPQNAYESASCKITDSLSNAEYFSAQKKNIKRKSLRNRNDNNSYKKDEEIDKPKSTDKQNDIKQQILLPNESAEFKQILENDQKKLTAVDKNLGTEKASGSDESEDNKERNVKSQYAKFKKSSLVSKESFQAEGKIEILTATKETAIQAENISSDNVDLKSANIEKKEKDVTDLSKEDKLSMMNETISNVRSTETCESATGRIESEKKIEVVANINIVNEEEISTRKSKILAESRADLDIKETSISGLPKQSFPLHEVGSTSEELDDEALEVTPDKSKFSSRKLTKTDKEKVRKITSTKNKTNKDNVSINESNIQGDKLTELEKEICIETFKNKVGQTNESMLLKTSESTQEKSKSPSKKLTGTVKIISTRNRTNEEWGFFNFQSKKPVDEEEETREYSKQSSESKSDPQEKSISGVMQVGIAVSIEHTIETSNEKAVKAEVRAAKQEKEIKIASNKKETIKEKLNAKETSDDEQILKFQEKDVNLKECSTKPKKEKPITEIMHDKTLDNTQDKTKSLREKSAVFDNNTEKVTKTISTRSRSNREDISASESSHQEQYPKKEAEISLAVDESKYYELLTTDIELNATSISSTINKVHKEEYFAKESSKDDNSTDKLLKVTLEDKKTDKTTQISKETETKITTQCKKSVFAIDEELSVNNKVLIASDRKEGTSPVASKSCTSEKAFNLAILSTNSNEEQSIRELSSSSLSTKIIPEMPVAKTESFLDINLAVENQTDNQSLSKDGIPCVNPQPIVSSPNSLIKYSPFKHAKSSKPSMETNLADVTQQTDKHRDTEKLVIDTSASNIQLENNLQKNKEQILVNKRAVTKRRGRKSRFKNLYGPEVDSETDSSNGKNTPVDEMKDQKLIIDIKTTYKKQVEDEALRSPQKVLQPEIEKKNEATIREEPVSLQEKSQGNLLCSQIKNVSIETNTLLDILRTVQSNTEAALKANKSPINIDENIAESTTKMQLEESLDLLKIQQASKIASPTQFDIESSTTIKKLNLSPARSDTISPLTVKKSIASPTRSNSSSPLTLKKVTRRYERRSRRSEVSEHKTLEETFAEIAAQSSKAVLAAKEYDVSEEQTTDEKSQKELDDINSVPNAEQQQIKENIAELQKPATDEKRKTTDERGSRLSEDSEHKTLEETFAEIAAQTCIAVLVTKEYDVIEEQTTNKKSQKELDDITVAPNIEQQQIKDNLSELLKITTDERRSRRGEDSAHTPLEETFAGIHAQSSKTILAAEEYDVSEEQTTNKKFQKELDDITSVPNIEKQKIKENFAELQKPTTDESRMSYKTLEETFSEIAAQSSKTVLAAKEFVVFEEQTKDEKSEKDFNDVNTAPNIEKEQLQKPTTDLEDKTLEILLNVSQDKTPIVSKEDMSNPTENVVEGDTIKVTPVKRGRKPKNRSLEAPLTITKDTLDVKNSPKTKKETTIIKEVGKEITMEKETMEIVKEETGNEDKTNKSKQIDEFPETIETTNFQVDSKVSEMPDKASLKSVEDVNENKSSKRSNKKRDTKAVIEDALVSNVAICIDKEGETITPKQPIKKRDSSLTKSDAKAVGKKLTKKTKNEDEDSLNLQKEESLVKTTANTPPPTKRGRKPKNQQQEKQQYTTSSKKKNKKDKNDTEDINVEKIKLLEFESESLNSSLDKSLDEKLAKKKRQKKLKEAFEAALADDIHKCKDILQSETCSPTSNTSFGLTLFNNSPPPEMGQSISNEGANEANKITCITPVETEEVPDPLKDIEKFIADGVNLLKKDYKLDEDSVDDVIQNTPSKTTEIAEEPVKVSTEETKPIFNIFETPADTPLNTPSVTPPPKSPTSTESSTPDENSGVRRSHRIKLITKTPKALVGRGLVRDKERFSIKDDVETKSHYTLDDQLTDLAEVEAKNAKFLKEMEERLSNFQVIKENEYLCERVISREARKMICDCFLTHEEEERGELGCGEDCLNRLLMIECGPECTVKERCTNKRFQKLLCSPCRVFRTEKKGFGIVADIEILPGEFIMEYVGEVIDTEEFEKRRIIYSLDKNRHYYFMALRSDAIIDATIKGNISRFINHSCEPNAETQKWTVNGELRIGFFSRKSIMPGEEITFNYQYQRYGREAQRCYCESANCRGWIGQEPTSDEGEQMDDEDDESEDDDEGGEADTSNLLVHDDDEDSDASVTDPEEVQKQLEMAAAQAEVELAPLQLLEAKAKHGQITADEGKAIQDLNKSDNEEDSKSKFKKLLSKMAEKVAAKQKQNKREQKLQRKKKSKESSSELTNKLRFLEDPDIEDEVEFLKECGLKNQSDTLRLSRLMVRAKLVQTRLNLLEILRKGDLPCRRLFLDYHGLRLLHGWMSEDAGNMQIRLSLLQTLDTLPIANKTVLTDSKVMQVVRNWCGNNTNLSPNDDSSSSNSNSQDILVPAAIVEGSDMAELQKLGLKLITTWEGLPEIFRIPKKERIEQMKEHEREADRQYAANAETQENIAATDRYRRDRFGRGLNTPNNAPNTSNRFAKPNSGNSHRTTNTPPENIKNLSKAQRREMFAAKVARDEAEKRLSEERREFETKCRFFGLDPKKTRAQDIPFCVNPSTGQWYSIERKPITTPPSYAHVQVPVKPKSTDPNDYQLPSVCNTLPLQWKYAITPQGKIYYYHIKHRIPQWEPPSPVQLQQCDLEARGEDSESELTTTAGEDSSDDDDSILIGMDAAQLNAYIDKKVEMRRQKRYQRLVDERPISPRREEDRIYNQLEVRKYKENKEKIRKRKEDIRRKRAETLRQTSLNMCTLGSITDTNPNTNKLSTECDDELGTVPIQDYLLSSDEEVDLKAEINSPLIDKIVEGDKIVDELDALTTKRQLKRPLPPHRDLNEPPATFSSSSASTSVSNTLVAKPDYKKRKLEKKDKRKPKEQDAKYRKNKEKFRCEIAGIIVHHLKPYLKETCTVGHIQSNEDFNHLARKLTHFVMIKELKYCESVGQTLVVTESVKSKSREFIKKYMAKYGDVYVKPTNDPDFKDIPFTL